MADEIVYKKVTRKADKGLEGKVIARHGKQTNQKLKPYVVLEYLMKYSKEMRTYRVDRMKDIRFTGEPRDGDEEFKKIDLKTYTKRVFSMYGGEQKLVEIRFINPLLDAVVDRFGTKDVQYAKVDETHFSVTAKVEISDQFFGWILGFGKKAKILYPDAVLDQFRAYMDKIREMY